MANERPLEEGSVEGILTVLDHPVPSVSADDLIARAQGRRRTRRLRSLRWAAGLALAVGAGAGVAWAAPGSPLGRWIEGLVRRTGLVVERPGQERTTAPDITSGISVVAGDAFVVRFVSLTPASRARVVLSDGDEVDVRSPSRMTGFASGPGELVVEHPTADTVHLSVPRSSARLEIWWGAGRVWTTEGGVVETTVRQGGDGAWVLGARR